MSFTSFGTEKSKATQNECEQEGRKNGSRFERRGRGLGQEKEGVNLQRTILINREKHRSGGPPKINSHQSEKGIKEDEEKVDRSHQQQLFLGLTNIEMEGKQKNLRKEALGSSAFLNLRGRKRFFSIWDAWPVEKSGILVLARRGTAGNRETIAAPVAREGQESRDRFFPSDISQREELGGGSRRRDASRSDRKGGKSHSMIGSKKLRVRGEKRGQRRELQYFVRLKKKDKLGLSWPKTSRKGGK